MAAAGAAESAKQARAANARCGALRRRVAGSIVRASGVGAASIGASWPRVLPRVALLFLKECLLDFIVDAQQPCFGASRTIAKVPSVGLELFDAFLGSPQLE